jgi:hypothetical protein
MIENCAKTNKNEVVKEACQIIVDEFNWLKNEAEGIKEGVSRWMTSSEVLKILDEINNDVKSQLWHNLFGNYMSCYTDVKETMFMNEKETKIPKYIICNRKDEIASIMWWYDVYKYQYRYDFTDNKLDKMSIKFVPTEYDYDTILWELYYRNWSSRFNAYGKKEAFVMSKKEMQSWIDQYTERYWEPIREKKWNYTEIATFSSEKTNTILEIDTLLVRFNLIQTPK